MAKKRNKQPSPWTEFLLRSPRIAFLYHHKIELTSLLLLLVGTFLLLENMQLRQRFFGTFEITFNALINSVISAFLSARHTILKIHLSDAIGIVLIIIASGLILYRIRERILDSGRFDLDRCPVCNTRLERTHRRLGDFLITTWFPLRRYSCMNNTCQWTGLLY